MARRLDPGTVLDVFAAQSALLVRWTKTLSAAELAQPSALPAWTIADLITHLALSVEMVAVVVHQGAARDVRPLALHEYVSAYARSATDIADIAQTTAAGEGNPPDLFARRTDEALVAARAVVGDPIVLGRRGPIRFSDLLATRVIELVVHGRDLGRSLPDNPPPGSQDAMRLVTRIFADALADRHPGRAVELRVPPYAAVQLLEGGAHTRGTPPNVIETAAETFVDLAAGRLSFEAAISSGAVRASGIRADLTSVLPVLG
jgi:uncharacterized protein (TIGR03083 family)